MIINNEINNLRSVDGRHLISKGTMSFQYKIKGLNETIKNDLMTMLILIPQDVPESYRKGFPDLDGIQYILFNKYC